MTTFLIHTFEVVTLLLVVGKLLQIKKLYKRSVQLNPSQVKGKAKNVRRATRIVKQPIATPQKTEFTKHSTQPFLQPFTNSKSLFSFHNLPLPEVTFSIDKEKPKAANKQAVQKPEIKTQAEIKPKHQVILNSYIDELFFESNASEATVLAKEVSKIVPSGNYRIDINEDDEFIVVAEENADLVRAFQASNQKLIYLR